MRRADHSTLSANLLWSPRAFRVPHTWMKSLIYYFLIERTLFEQLLYCSGCLCSIYLSLDFLLLYFYYFNSMGSLCFLYPCNIIARIAERTAAVRMIKQAKTSLSLNRGHHPKAWQTAVPVRGRSSPNLLHTTHLITQIRSQSPELPPSLKRWDHLCNPISVPVKMDSCRRVKAALLGTSIVLSYWSELGSMGAWKLPIQTKTKQSFVHPTCHFKLEVVYITHHALTTSVNSTPLWLLKFICMLSLIFPCSVKPFCTQTPLAAVGNLPAKDANKQSSNKYWAYSRSVSAGTVTGMCHRYMGADTFAWPESILNAQL